MTDENTIDEGAVAPVPEPPKPPKPSVPKPPEPNTVQAPQPQAWSPDPGEEIDEAPHKSPVAAALLSLVPFGLGHLYLGQYARAIAVFVGFWVPLLILGLPLLGIFFYFLGIFDAFRQAQLINLAAREGHELPAGSFQGGLAAGVFLVVLGGVLICRQWIDLYLIREFFQDWWPALLVLIGVYFIYEAIKENKDPGESDEIDSF
jgi:TM2 domain-containing membrane protein YozV